LLNLCGDGVGRVRLGFFGWFMLVKFLWVLLFDINVVIGSCIVLILGVNASLYLLLKLIWEDSL
jgi:hypothetical protein